MTLKALISGAVIFSVVGLALIPFPGPGIPILLIGGILGLTAGAIAISQRR